MTAGHTKTPWQPHQGNDWRIRDADGNSVVGIIHGNPSEVQQIRAAVILCVNAHADLVKAAINVLEWWKVHQYDTHSCANCEYNVYDEEPAMVISARAALAKARKEA